ncbi:MAG TPA: hypothetical protein VE860_15445 [Chthoniobacterales bacterium]|jgi:asparagine synthetase B (glutamine-hydrolysing)|nr:hypothetical protein [Chthoniobacterales bacterium]
MCGIAGIVDLYGHREIPDDIIDGMTRAIIHRGPDEEGYCGVRGDSCDQFPAGGTAIQRGGALECRSFIPGANQQAC